MQVLYDIVGLKYLYDKIPINKIVLKNLKEIAVTVQYNFDNEINEFTNLRNTILVEQYKGDKEQLLKLYKEYLFFFEIFKQKNLLKCSKSLYSNDVFQKNVKVEYDFEEENIIIFYNIGLLNSALAKSQNDIEDVKVKNKISMEAIHVFHYLFENINNGKLKGLTDVNCVSCFIFLCISSAYHENLLYNTAVLKKYKRNLLTKLSFNIYTYFNNALLCLNGKMIASFQNPAIFNKCMKNLQYIRNTNGFFYNYILTNKYIFICVSNYHAALKYIEFNEGEDLKVKRYEVDNLGEIICRFQYALENVNKSIELCKKINLKINSASLKSKIEKFLQFFEYENTHIYFESIPEYSQLNPLKGTEVIKVQNVNPSKFYTKKKISVLLNFLLNEKSRIIYEQYNKELHIVCDVMYKKVVSLNERYKLMTLSQRKNIISILSHTLVNQYSVLKRSCLPYAVFEERLTQLQNMEEQLQQIINQADTSLQNENKNHLEFQRGFAHLCRISQDSLNSYNNFLYHLENFKKSLEDLQKNNALFKRFLDENYSTFQICDMEVNAFVEYVVTQLNHAVDLNVDTVEKDYKYFKELLNEKKEPEKGEKVESVSSVNTNGSIYSSEEFANKSAIRPTHNYESFLNFLKKHNINHLIKTGILSDNVAYSDILNKYTMVQTEEKLYFVIVSLYYSCGVTLTELFNEINEWRSNTDEDFINDLNTETDADKLQELLQKQKEKLNEIKIKKNEKIVLLEQEMDTFHNYYLEYNKLDVFKTVDEINVFIRELLKMMDKINKLNQAHSLTLSSAILFRDDINKYIFMRESERSKIRVQPTYDYQNYYQNNYPNSHQNNYPNNSQNNYPNNDSHYY